MSTNLFEAAGQCLFQPDPLQKVRLSRDTARLWRAGELALGVAPEPLPISEPGRPQRPRLVPPRSLPRRSLASREGHAALIHAIAHIEFNAINLAWDAVYRFRELPDDYYRDWVRVADEEAYHFSLVNRHLNTLGFSYGDFDAHDGLWEMTQKTAHDVLERMALVPRVLEARGLDVTPGIMAKLAQYGDTEGVEILKIILRDEVGHVEIGSRWFHTFCAQRQLDPQTTFQELFQRYMKMPAKGSAKGGLHREARLAAGFSAAELDYLEGVG